MVPRRAELKREGDRVTVICKEDRSLSWQRRCVGTEWEGELGTCPSHVTDAADKQPGPLPIGKSGALVADHLLLCMGASSTALQHEKMEETELDETVVYGLYATDKA